MTGIHDTSKPTFYIPASEASCLSSSYYTEQTSHVVRTTHTSPLSRFSQSTSSHGTPGEHTGYTRDTDYTKKARRYADMSHTHGVLLNSLVMDVSPQSRKDLSTATAVETVAESHQTSLRLSESLTDQLQSNQTALLWAHNPCEVRR